MALFRHFKDGEMRVQIFVDEDTEFGAKIHRFAAERGASAEEFMIAAVRDDLDK